MNQKEAIAKLVRLYTQEQSLAEEIKEVKDEAKESDLDASIISAVAKAIVKGKVDELKEKSDEIIKAIEVSRS
jgi:hypothetical protein